MNWLKKLLERADDPFEELWKHIKVEIDDRIEDAKRDARIAVEKQLLLTGVRMSLRRLADLDAENKLKYDAALLQIGT